MSVETIQIAEQVLERPELNRSSSILSLLFENIQFNNQVHIEIDDLANYVPVGQGTEVSLLMWLQNSHDVPI